MADKEFEASEEVVETVEETAVEDEPKKSAAKSKKEVKKPNFFVRIGLSLKKFWKTMKSEMKKITWYNRKQTFNSTLLVIFAMIAFGVAIGVVDWAFSRGLEGLGNLF